MRRLADYGVKRTLEGNFQCLCKSVFVGAIAAEQCARCWLRHGWETLDAALRAALPASSMPGLGGRWLAVGERCSSCGSTAGGWICEGCSGHVASCEEALLFQGKWASLHVDRGGVLQVDSKHCVHGNGGCRMKDDELRAIVTHDACAS